MGRQFVQKKYTYSRALTQPVRDNFSQLPIIISKNQDLTVIKKTCTDGIRSSPPPGFPAGQTNLRRWNHQDRGQVPDILRRRKTVPFHTNLRIMAFPLQGPDENRQISALFLTQGRERSWCRESSPAPSRGSKRCPSMWSWMSPVVFQGSPS